MPTATSDTQVQRWCDVISAPSSSSRCRAPPAQYSITKPRNYGRVTARTLHGARRHQEHHDGELALEGLEHLLALGRGLPDLSS